MTLRGVGFTVYVNDCVPIGPTFGAEPLPLSAVGGAQSLKLLACYVPVSTCMCRNSESDTADANENV